MTESALQKMYETVAASVVFISNQRSFGSGFFVNTSGLVLTNAHVVDKNGTIDVVLHSGKKVKGRVVERGLSNLDVALIQLPLKNTRPLAIESETPVRIGSWVGSVGHGAGGIWTLNIGIVSNIYPDGAKHPVFQTQIPLNPGSSGGPIFNCKGNVVGIVTAGLSNSNSINFGIKMNVAIQGLKHLQQQLGTLVKGVWILAPKNTPIYLDNKMVGTGPKQFVSVKDGPHEVFILVNGRMFKKTFVFPAQKKVSFD